MRLPLSLFLTLILTMTASAHDEWANGTKIPAWIKSHCCNGEEAHDLTKEMGVSAGDVRAREGGPVVINGMEGMRYLYYRVRGFENEVTQNKVYPSQDGDVWAFYAQGGPPQAMIWCLFVPCVTNPDMPAELDSGCS